MRFCLGFSHEWEKSDVPCALDSYAQVTLLTLGQAALLAGFDLAVLVYVALQGLEVLVVKVSYVSAVLKNLCHGLHPYY
jgi:hypothetical protein